MKCKREAAMCSRPQDSRDMAVPKAHKKSLRR